MTTSCEWQQQQHVSGSNTLFHSHQSSLTTSTITWQCHAPSCKPFLLNQNIPLSPVISRFLPEKTGGRTLVHSPLNIYIYIYIYIYIRCFFIYAYMYMLHTIMVSVNKTLLKSRIPLVRGGEGTVD